MLKEFKAQQGYKPKTRKDLLFLRKKRVEMVKEKFICGCPIPVSGNKL